MLLFEGDDLSTEPHIQQGGRVSTTMAEQLKIREEDGVVHLKRMETLVAEAGAPLCTVRRCISSLSERIED